MIPEVKRLCVTCVDVKIPFDLNIFLEYDSKNMV